MTWQWQLSGEVNTGYDVELYDIDLFDSSSALIAQLKSSGRRVICYFSAGTFEEWRADSVDFNASDLGRALDDWPGERWLDIRSNSVRKVMQSRLDIARAKGCDGVEPDNVDGYSNANGLNLNAADQIDYNLFLAREAHSRRLAIGLKNDLEQVSVLVNKFDFAVNEQCYQYNECHLLAPFVKAGKPVLNVEYRSTYVNNAAQRAILCADSRSRRFSTLLLPIALNDAFRLSCQS